MLVCYLFRNQILQIKLLEKVMVINFGNDLKGVPNILPTKLPMTLLIYSQDVRSFIIFTKVLLYAQF